MQVRGPASFTGSSGQHGAKATACISRDLCSQSLVYRLKYLVPLIHYTKGNIAVSSWGVRNGLIIEVEGI